MEWPAIDLNVDLDYVDRDVVTDEFVSDLAPEVVTKEIYARAASACLADATVDHRRSGLEAKVEAFLRKLRSEHDNWEAREHRSVAREFVELIVGTGSRARTIEICQGGLDAAHDILQYRLPNDSRDARKSSTILAAKDAFVLCRSFPRLETSRVVGTRPPDIGYRYGLATKAPPNNNSNSNAAFDENEARSLFGVDACEAVSEMQKLGLLETSAASLAKHTFTNADIVSRLGGKTFVVLGCDHPLAPTKSLLRIPGVTVLGVPSCRAGLDSVVDYVRYSSPDDATFVYPSVPGNSDENPITSRGPQVAQWILDSAKESLSSCGSNSPDTELVLVPMSSLNNSTAASDESSVRYAVALDLIVQRVLRAFSSGDETKLSMWSYQSPTTCAVVPPVSATRSAESLKNRPSLEPWLRALSGGVALTPATGDESEDRAGDADISSSNNYQYSIVNGVIAEKGPHRVLEESIRMWRCIVTNHNCHDDYDEFDTDVHVFAPYVPLLEGDGVTVLEPLKAFDPAVAASLMAAISIAGLTDPIVNRPMPIIEEEEGYGGVVHETTPFAMFWNGSVHGGMWHCPYTLDSVNGYAGYLLGKTYEYYDAYVGGGGVGDDSRNTASAASSIGNGYGGPADTSESDNSSEAGEPIELPDSVRERLEMLS